MEKVKDEDFLLGEENLIKLFGKEFITDLKKNNYNAYVDLRNCPAFMPSDIIRDERPQRKKHLKIKKSTILHDGKTD